MKIAKTGLNYSIKSLFRGWTLKRQNVKRLSDAAGPNITRQGNRAARRSDVQPLSKPKQEGRRWWAAESRVGGDRSWQILSASHRSLEHPSPPPCRQSQDAECHRAERQGDEHGAELVATGSQRQHGGREWERGRQGPSAGEQAGHAGAAALQPRVSGAGIQGSGGCQVSISGGGKACFGFGVAVKINRRKGKSIIYQLWISRAARENCGVVKLRDCEALKSLEDYEVAEARNYRGN